MRTATPLKTISLALIDNSDPDPTAAVRYPLDMAGRARLTCSARIGLPPLVSAPDLGYGLVVQNDAARLDEYRGSHFRHLSSLHSDDAEVSVSHTATVERSRDFNHARDQSWRRASRQIRVHPFVRWAQDLFICVLT